MTKEKLKMEVFWGLILRRKAEGKSGRRPTVHSHELGGPMKRKRKLKMRRMSDMRYMRNLKRWKMLKI